MKNRFAMTIKLFLTLGIMIFLSSGFFQESLMYAFPQFSVQDNIFIVKAAGGQWIKESNGKWWYKHNVIAASPSWNNTSNHGIKSSYHKER